MLLKDATGRTGGKIYAVDASQYPQWPSRSHQRPRKLQAILRSVLEKKPIQSSGPVKPADATAGALQSSHRVDCELLPQLQQWLQVELGEECPRIFKPILDPTVPPMAEGYVRRTVAFTFAKVVGAQVERQLTDLFTTPDQSALGTGLFDLIEPVLEGGVRSLAVS